MSSRRSIAAALVIFSVASVAAAQNVRGDAPVGEPNPLLRLEAGGPTAAVTAMAFDPDGRTLYAAGYDKVVRVWRLGQDGKTFEIDPRATFRVPIGPGRDGILNVLAVSPDGRWLAVSGLGVFRGGSAFGQGGWVNPDEALTPAMRQERATIYLFDTRSRAVALLRGHEEDVLALAFAPPQPDRPQLLVSVGRKAGDRPGKVTGRVCVWDVGKGSAIDDRGQLVDHGAKVQDWLDPDIGAVPGEPPPGLAVRQTAEERLRILTAWGDGKLRVREVGQTGESFSADEPRNVDRTPAQFTHTITAAPGLVVTGGFVRSQGYLLGWDDGAGRAPRSTVWLQLPPPAGASYTLPRAVSLVSSGVGQGLDHAAVVLRSPARQGTAGFDYRLALLDLKAFRLVERSDDDARLGTWTKPPVMASAADGRFLAVTGDQNREIRVFAAGDLFGRRPAWQSLRSVGATAAAVAFARGGSSADLGLVLRPEAAGTNPGRLSALAATDVVLDIGKRTLAPNPGGQGWRLTSPADDGWRVERDAAAPDVFHWSGPSGRGTTRLNVTPTQQVTAFAIVPAVRPLTEPVLAVATWDGAVGEPLLALYRTSTGQQLRWLNGHVQPVTSVAATPDGRLLASAAEDQTVSVWSMTDLAEILGRHATLSGVAIRHDERSSVVVERVDARSTAANVLAAGDVIRTVTPVGPDRKPRAVASPREFFDAVWAEKPGDALSLTVRRGGAEHTGSVWLDQAVDERKPLVSLFVTRDRKPEWIAWTPLGPYDASSRAVERYLGWHFNPPRPGEAVRFAGADAYRERLHKPGLLNTLLARANLTDALRDLEKPVSVPRATILAAVDGAEPVAAGEQVLVRLQKANLRLRVQGPSLDRNEVESITWRVNGGAPQPMPLDGANGDVLTQQIDLAARGVYRIQVCLRTREAEPQEVTRDLVLRYQPPPPRIRLDSPAEPRLTVRDAQFRLRAAVEPGIPGQKVTVSFRNGKGDTQPVGTRVDEPVTLAPGENVLDVRAVNDGALSGFEDSESDHRTVVVVFQRKDAPQVLLSAVSPQVPPGAAVEVTPGRPVTVGAHTVRILGRITAAEPLTIAQMGGKSLKGFRPGTAREFAIDEEVSLQPGEQELLVRAQTANSVEAEARLTVVHRPPLPVLTMTEPDPDRSLTEGKDPREVEVRASVTPPDGLPAGDVRPYEALIRVVNNGRPIAQGDGQESVVMRSDRLPPSGALSAKLHVEPGDNRIEVVLRNKWQTAPAVERHLYFRRPPRLVGPVTTSVPGEKPFTDVVAEVESASDLTHVECNGREYPVAEVVELVRDSAWRVTLSQVPLVRGANAIRLLVSNRDGPALTEGTASVQFTPPKPRPVAEIELANKPSGALKEPQFTAQFVVHSAGSRVSRVELRQDGRVLATLTDPAQVDGGASIFTAAGELGPIALREGANSLRLVAVNGGGEADLPFTITHIPVPEWLEIDQPGSALPRSEFILTGRVRWTGAARPAEMERKLKRLRVYVNGAYQQPQPEIRPAGPHCLEFAVKVTLNQKECNQIDIDCPDLRPDAGGRQKFAVDCPNLQTEPRTLHLLVVNVTPGGAGGPDKALAIRALKALGARGAGDLGLRSPVFQRVMMHPYVKDQPTQVVSGYVTCEHVRDALESIRRNSKPNDVALIYWLGREAVDEAGDLYLLTSESRPGRKLAHSAIALREILEFPHDVPGACALLLDTVSTGPAPETPVAVPLPTTRVAVLRYAWTGAGGTVPGLLQALEESSQKREATSLNDLAAAAARTIKASGRPPAWEDNLKELPALADLVISRRPE